MFSLAPLFIGRLLDSEFPVYLASPAGAYPPSHSPTRPLPPPPGHRIRFHGPRVAAAYAWQPAGEPQPAGGDRQEAAQGPPGPLRGPGEEEEESGGGHAEAAWAGCRRLGRSGSWPPKRRPPCWVEKGAAVLGRSGPPRRLPGSGNLRTVQLDAAPGTMPLRWRPRHAMARRGSRRCPRCTSVIRSGAERSDPLSWQRRVRSRVICP